MNIFALADTASNWYPKNAINQFTRYTKLDFTDTPAKAELIWIFSYYNRLFSLLNLPEAAARFLPQLVNRRRSIRQVPIVTTVHHLTPSKKNVWLPRIELLDRLTDYWQTSSPINLPYIRKFTTKPIKIMPYWIDTREYFPLSSARRRKARLKHDLPADKTIIGSFQRDTEADLVSPKLEKGPDILCDTLEKLDRNKVFVVLTGPRRHYVESRLSAKSVPHRSFGHMPYGAMNELYNCLDYYLVTSRHEGGPQAILEAMATRTKIYSTYVGMADVLSPRVIFSDPRQAAKRLNLPYPEVLDQHYQTALSYECGQVIPRYEKFFADVIKEYAAARTVSV